MEDAADALKIAFAMFVFMMALGISINMFSQLNNVSKVVIGSSDITSSYQYTPAEEARQSREVGLETIIPTLYKYYKENYTVIFLDTDGEPLPLYETQIPSNLWGTVNALGTNEEDRGVIGKYYTTSTERTEWANEDDNPVCSFDVDEETVRHEPWTGSPEDYKKNLDYFLNGESTEYNSSIGSVGTVTYDYGASGSFINQYSERKFKEMLGEYTYTNENGDEYDASDTNVTTRKKRVIIYQLMS